MLAALSLLAATVLLLTKGAASTPDDSRAEALSRQYETVTAAATAQTEAFLTVDYKDMDPLIEKVLDGATGTFEEQYEKGKADLKASTQRSQAVSSGEVLSVGVADIDADNAVVLVAADSEVTNGSTQGKAQPRYYRLELTMVRQGDRWLTSDLQFVG